MHPKNSSLFLFTACILLIASQFTSCTKTEDEIVETTLTGSIVSFTTEKAIFPAFIIHEDELLATTNEEGTFTLTNIDAGSYKILFSALGFADREMEIQVEENIINMLDIHLNSDHDAGRMVGEFQDGPLYQTEVAADPDKMNWTEKEIYDGVSGATIQPWRWPVEISEGEIYLGDSLIASADEYGQFWYALQSGTYPITAKTEGYKDLTRIISIKTNEKGYSNFVMDTP